MGRITNYVRILMVVTAFSVVAVACGGSSGGGSSSPGTQAGSPPATSTTPPATSTAPPPSTGGIPQNNGGDGDSDNNGGTERRGWRPVRRRVAALATLLVLGSGCGGSGVAQAPSTSAPAFSWLKPAAAPADWKTATTPAGAVLAYPPGWHAISGDPGTASAALTASGGLIVGYLNATPATSSEVPSSWARFRVDHNGEEGDRHVHLIAQAA